MHHFVYLRLTVRGVMTISSPDERASRVSTGCLPILFDPAVLFSMLYMCASPHRKEHREGPGSQDSPLGSAIICLEDDEQVDQGY